MNNKISGAHVWCDDQLKLTALEPFILKSYIASFFSHAMSLSSIEIFNKIKIPAYQYYKDARKEAGGSNGAPYEKFPKWINELAEEKYHIRGKDGKKHSFKLIESFKQHVDSRNVYEITITGEFLWLVANTLGPRNLRGLRPTEIASVEKMSNYAVLRQLLPKIKNLPLGESFFMPMEDAICLYRLSGSSTNSASRQRQLLRTNLPKKLNPCLECKYDGDHKGFVFTVEEEIQVQEPSQIRYDTTRRTNLSDIFTDNLESLRGIMCNFCVDDRFGANIAKNYRRDGDYEGYVCARNSTVSSLGEEEWLSYEEYSKGIEIERQHKVGKYIADGYCPETNTIYEYFGDYYHGNLDVFREDQKSIRRTTMLEENAKTKEKICFYESKGFEVEFIWESDWNEKKKDASIKEFLKGNIYRHDTTSGPLGMLTFRETVAREKERK